MAEHIELLRSQTFYRSAKVALTLDRFATPDGEIERPVAHHAPTVALIVRPDPEHLLCVRQYRYPLQRWTVEVPAGTSDPGETVEHAARRELGEETGYTCERLVERLRFNPSVGICDELMVVFEAFELGSTARDPDQGELVSPELVALADIPALVAAGEICDGKTLLVLSLLGLLPEMRSC